MKLSASSENRSEISERCCKVLFVDDSVQDFRLISVLVKNQAQNEYSFDWARDSKEALDRLEAGGIDLVAVDYNLGLEYGSEVINQLSAKFPDPPYILVTGDQDPEVYKKGLESGAENFVPKGKDCGVQFDRIAQFAIERKRATTSLKLASASKDWLLSLVSKDLANPLFGLNELLSTLTREGSKMTREELMELIETAYHTSCESIVSANDMMEWGRNVNGPVKPQMSMVNLETVFQRSMRLLTPLADEKDVLLYISGTFALKVYTDERMLLSATRNLISASLFYAKEGTDLSITAEPGNRQMAVSIKSCGNGIAAELFQKLAENPDVTNDLPRTAEQQALISLQISNHLLSAMGNTLAIVNRPNESIECSFDLPMTLPLDA